MGLGAKRHVGFFILIFFKQQLQLKSAQPNLAPLTLTIGLMFSFCIIVLVSHVLIELVWCFRFRCDHILSFGKGSSQLSYTRVETRWGSWGWWETRGERGPATLMCAKRNSLCKACKRLRMLWSLRVGMRGMVGVLKLEKYRVISDGNGGTKTCNFTKFCPLAFNA